MAPKLWAQATPAEPEWVYRAVAGDHLIGIARNYLLPQYGWEHLQQRNKLRDPNQILPGEAVTIPVAWLRRDAGVAEIIYVRGDATLRTGPAGEAQPAKVGGTVSPVTTLLTGEQSSLVLRFADGSRLMLTAGTQVTIERLLVYGRSGLAQSNVQLLNGGVDAQVPARPVPVVPLEIRTPTATLGVRGTQFRATTDAQSNVSRVEVLSGTVAAQAGREIRVEAGFGAIAAATLSDPRALLAAPVLVPGAPRLSALPVAQQWQPVPGAALYRAQLFADAQGSQLLTDRTTPETSTRWDTLADGRYWLRVRAVAADGLEGVDAQRSFEFVSAPELPPLPVAPPEGDTLTGSAAVLAWHAASPAARYRVQVAASPDFNAPVLDAASVEAGPYNLVQWRVALAPGRWYWRVAGLSAGGSAGPFSAPGSFVLRPAAP
jgi:hypothetical protein